MIYKSLLRFAVRSIFSAIILAALLAGPIIILILLSDRFAM